MLTPSRPAKTPRLDFDPEAFLRIVLSAVQREYPYHLSVVARSDEDVRPARELTPCFSGSYDWHSAVHGHWSLSRLLRLLPDAHSADAAKKFLAANLTEERIESERVFLSARPGFERPYGIAWLVALEAELRSTYPELAQRIMPLADVARAHLQAWLPKLSHPVRSGTHSQTAFALGLFWDSCVALRPFLEEQARRLYLDDHDYAPHLEPSGEDFVSPSLGACDLMARVLDQGAFQAWFSRVLPRGFGLTPPKVTDASDGRLVHLAGLNLSRAFMLKRIGEALGHARFDSLAANHRIEGLKEVNDEHYAGSHWLVTFALV